MYLTDDIEEAECVVGEVVAHLSSKWTFLQVNTAYVDSVESSNRVPAAKSTSLQLTPDVLKYAPVQRTAATQNAARKTFRAAIVRSRGTT